MLLQPGHKWNNIVFFNHTGLRTYPNYMMGGGYIVSGDVADMVKAIHQKMQLKFTPIEDATMGFWLAAMVRSLQHSPLFPGCELVRSRAALCWFALLIEQSMGESEENIM